MERKYPVKYFCLFVLTNFLFHYFYLFVPGVILCIVGIWSKTCLSLGLAVLILDLTLSVMEQLKLRKAAITPSLIRILMRLWTHSALPAACRLSEKL